MISAFDFIDSQREEMIKLWENIVNIDSSSYFKKGVDEVSELIQNILNREEVNVSIEVFNDAGNLLIGRLGADRKEKAIGLLGHMDTVLPGGKDNKRRFEIQNGLAYGSGVIDMKGGLVCIIYAIKALNRIGYNKRPIKIILAGDEEIGHINSNAEEIIKNQLKDCEYVFNCETGQIDDALVVSRKGSGKFYLEVEGIAAHAGKDLEKGRSAIKEIAHKILDIENLTNFHTGITYNVGVIEGGSVHNAVPDYAKIEIDVRYKSIDQEEKIMEDLNKVSKKNYISGTKSNLFGNISFRPMELKECNLELFEKVKETAMELGLEEPYAIVSGGASDSYIPVMMDIPTVCAMGVKGEWNHSINEYGVVESLFERTKLLIACIMKL